MRKIIAVIVVMALVGTLVSWVPYVYSHHEDGAINVAGFDDGNSHQHSENAGECDHCCHFGAHVVAVVMTNNFLIRYFDKAIYPSLRSWPPSHEAVPPGPPPKHLV